jgi:serine/threonine-protein phosphatase 2A regulatory subunit B
VTGNFLATGDKGGRVVLFERNHAASLKAPVYTEFQSHEPEFDYLKSLEIEEKINKIRWCGRQNSAHLLLSTNGALSLPVASLSILTEWIY